MDKDFIYLASASKSRQNLLKEAQIPFKIIEHSANESLINLNQSINKIVEKIAILKMEHVLLSDIEKLKEAPIYVLTADTLTSDKNGNIYGKPKNYDDAIKKIKSFRDGGIVTTSFCLDKKIFFNDFFNTEKRIIKTLEAECCCDVPDEYIEKYIEKCNALNIAGGLSVDGYGSLFTKYISGSYTAIIGLPMYELREALEELSFIF